MRRHLIFAVVFLLFVSLFVIELSFVREIDWVKDAWGYEGRGFLHFCGMGFGGMFSIVTLKMWVSPDDEINK